MINKLLQECLDGRTGSYIRPLIWYGGESAEKLSQEIRAVRDGGCREFILENRGGNWFNTEHWWNILGSALETAKQLQMRLWLLDDSHVNTGSANDTLSLPENAEFRPVCLRIEIADYAGPIKSAFMLPAMTDKEKIVSISAYSREENTGRRIGELVDLTANQQDKLCLVDLPEGFWRVCFVMTADPSRQGFFTNYITMLSQKSCRHLIDEVHEKCWQHCKAYFGNTFAGFFSDEPAFGNCDGQYGLDSCDYRMGQLRRLYPWWENVPDLMAERLDWDKSKVMTALPALWNNVDGISETMRIAYMDVITHLWQKNFSEQIGNWCREHHVEYIGHMLEDRGAHFHTGWGCGHFFRAMAGQDMAGMDIVLNQIVPGFRTISHASNSSKKEFDSVFYHYTLAKMGSSLAHLMPHMKNRSICEVFGAYGWTCGLPVMRSIFNHFLTSGTNNFIPHAYSMHLPGPARRSSGEETKAPPGYCMTHMAPTFYMGGMNPQYPQFGKLMLYVQRASHLISTGVHQADVALFYSAEGDWTGCSIRPLDEVAMCLSRSGIDFDFVPSDTLFSQATVREGKLQINQESYGMLVVPMSESYPKKLLEVFARLADQGLPVVFTDALPVRVSDNAEPLGNLCAKCISVPLAELPEAVQHTCGLKLFSTEQEVRSSLRFYGVKQEDGTLVYLFYNDGMKTLETVVHPVNGLPGYLYDPWKNQIFGAENSPAGMKLKLRPQQLLTCIFTQELPSDLPIFPYEEPVFADLPLHFDISMREAGEQEYRLLRKDSEAVDLLQTEHLTRTCAEFQYDTCFQWDDRQVEWLELPYAGDFAELWINGKFCGTELGPVCRFKIKDLLKKGMNSLRIHTADNPSYMDRDAEIEIYGCKLPLAPHGFVGPVRID